MNCVPNPQITWLPTGWKQCKDCGTQWGSKETPTCFARPLETVRLGEYQPMTHQEKVENIKDHDCDECPDPMDAARWGKQGMYYQ